MKKLEIEREGYLKVFGTPIRHTKPKKFWIVLKKTGTFCCFKEKFEDKNAISAQDIIFTCQLGPSFVIKDKDDTPRDKKSKDKLKYTFVLEDTANKDFSVTIYCGTEAEAKEWRSLLSSKIEGRKYFGMPLSKLVGPSIGRVPVLVTDAIRRLQQSLHTTGLLRHSGNVALIERWKNAYDRGDKVNLTLEEDPHIVAGILRAFLRELPEPLIGYSNYQRFVDIAKESDHSRRIAALKQLVESLPPENAALLDVLMKFFKQIDAQNAVNKMTAKNISIVMSPIICRAEVARLDMQSAADGNAIVSLVEVMILECETIFQNIAQESAHDVRAAVDVTTENANVSTTTPSDQSTKRSRKSRPKMQSVKSMSALSFPTMPSLQSRALLSARTSATTTTTSTPSLLPLTSASSSPSAATNPFAPLLAPLPPPLVDTQLTTNLEVRKATNSHSRRSHTVSFATAPLINTFGASLPKPLAQTDDNVKSSPNLTEPTDAQQSITVSSSVPVPTPSNVSSETPQNVASSENLKMSNANPNEMISLNQRLDHIEDRLSKIEGTLSHIVNLLEMLSSTKSKEGITTKNIASTKTK
jgi:predicted transposase YbfD/YdcC